MLPLIARIYMKKNDHKKRSWFIPLFFLWQFVFLILLLLLPWFCLWDAILWLRRSSKPSMLKMTLQSMRIIWASRGLDINITEPKSKIRIYII